MNHFMSLSYALVWLLQLSSQGVYGLTESRSRFNFNSDWKVLVGDATGAGNVSFDDSAWKGVTLPYAWNEDEAFRLDIANLSTGIAWYRKHFKVPSSTSSKKIFLEFEGIRHGGEFYLNGHWLGRHENGVMAFGFDVTSYISQEKDNVLAARIDNSWDYREVSTNQKYQWADRNFYANYGGINKNVYLHVTDKLHQTLPLYSNLQTTGVYIYAKNIDVAQASATVTAETQVQNEYTESKTFAYQVTIQSPDGKVLKTLDGGRYTLSANQTKTFNASGSVSNLQFWSWGYGYLYDVSTILSMDGTEVDKVTTRTGFRKTEFSHGMFKLNDRVLHLKGYAQRTTNEWPSLGSAVPAFLSDFSNQLVIDSHGSLVRWMHVTPWKQDVESCDRVGLMQSMPAGDSEGDVTGRRWEQRVELMRDAIIYNRNNPSVVFYESGNSGVSEEHMSQMKKVRDTYDPFGGRAAGCREMLNSSVAEYGGEMLYVNKGRRIPFFAHEYSRDEGLRKYWDNYSAPYHPDGAGAGSGAEYNRNQDSHAVENVARWYDYFSQRPGTGERVNAGGVNIIFSDSNTHHRGAENYRRSGEVDAMRLAKDGWYAHRVMWDNWVDVESPATYIVGHWNYNTSTTKTVNVVSTAERVELFLNGKSLGTGKLSNRFLFTFPNITWQAGNLTAVGLDGGKQTSTNTKVTAGDAVAVRLTSRVSPAGFHADGADIALVDVEVIDASGNRCPTALNMVDFTISGEATWRGGIAQGPNNYILAKSLPVENGINRVMLRATTKAGKITLKAASAGLTSASVELLTVEFETKDGLATLLPGDGLPPNLARGPTPSGASFKATRQTVHIVSSSAGSGNDPVQSYDDNEVTSWKSGSSTSAAWVTYRLEKTTKINQVVLKTESHRTKSYPVKVSVDNKVVYTGRLPTSLGYNTVEFAAANASNVTIASTDDVLAIVEVELYSPVE